MRIGANTFGLAQALTEDFDGTLRSLARGGLTDLEPCIFCRQPQGVPAAALQQKLLQMQKDGGWWLKPLVKERVESVRALGLSVEGAHLLMLPKEAEEIRAQIPELVRIAQENDLHFYVTSGQAGSRAAIAPVLGALRDLEEALRENGIDLLYHNHKDEFALDGEKEVLAYILEEIPDMKLEMDVGWVLYAGVDVLEKMDTYADRLRIVHVKDIAPGATEETLEQSFPAIGEGALPLREVLELARTLPLYESCSIILDQDASTGSMVEDICRGVANVKRIQEEMAR